jgi:predicted phosphodiesterase
MKSSYALLGNPYRLPEPGGFDFRSLEMRLKGDWLVTSDFHLPYYHQGLANIMLKAARDAGIRQMLIAGDLFNLGYLSTFRQYYEMLGENLDNDLAMGKELFQALLRQMDWVVLLPGNHDERLQKALADKVSYKKAVELFIPDNLQSKVQTSPLPYVWVDTPRGPFRVTHPKSYSRVPLAVPRSLAEKYHANVISAHGHHFAVGTSASGQYVVAESGGLFDVDRIDYRFLAGDTTHPEWAKGFLLLVGGRLVPYGDYVGA